MVGVPVFAGVGLAGAGVGAVRGMVTHAAGFFPVGLACGAAVGAAVGAVVGNNPLARERRDG